MRRDPVPLMEQVRRQSGPGELSEITLPDGLVDATGWDVEAVNPDIPAPVP
jgi:hypothetical protein